MYMTGVTVLRVSTSKAYNAVPPPQHLLVGVHTVSGIVENKISDRTAAASVCSSTICTTLSPSVIAVSPAVAMVSTAHSQATGPPGVVNYGKPPVSTTNGCPPSFTGGTNYNGYGGIYPQATPLQQVALALIQPLTQSPPVQVASSDASINSPGPEKPRTGQRSHRRKFQELPTELKGSAGHQKVHVSCLLLKYQVKSLVVNAVMLLAFFWFLSARPVLVDDLIVFLLIYGHFLYTAYNRFCCDPIKLAYLRFFKSNV